MKKKLTAVALVVCMLAIMLVGASLAYFTDKDQVANTFTVGNVKIDLYETKKDEDGKTIVDNDGNPMRFDGITFDDAIVPGRVFAKDPTIKVETGSQDAYIFLDMTINKYKSLCPVMAQDAVADTTIAYTEDDFQACMKQTNNGIKFSTTEFLAQMKAKPAVFRAIVDKWFDGINHEQWKTCGFFYNVDDTDTTKDGNYMTIRFAYIGKDTVSAEDAPITFMTAFHMPKSVTQEMVENTKANVTAFNDAKVGFKMNFTAYAIQADQIANVSDAFTALFGTKTELGAYWHPVDQQ